MTATYLGLCGDRRGGMVFAQEFGSEGGDSGAYLGIFLLFVGRLGKARENFDQVHFGVTKEQNVQCF